MKVMMMMMMLRITTNATIIIIYNNYKLSTRLKPPDNEFINHKNLFKNREFVNKPVAHVFHE